MADGPTQTNEVARESQRVLESARECQRELDRARECQRELESAIATENTGCSVFTAIFQEPFTGTSNA